MDPAALQQPFDAAVVIQTILRPTLLQAARSVFAQDCRGRIQIVLGIDCRHGDPLLIDQIRAECPDHIALTVIDPGYSTSQRHGSLYPNHFGGALRTALSYLANSRLVAYLDDDNWWTPQHLSTMLAAIAGKSWAFSLRSLVDHRLDEVICRDEWESLGPGRGVYVAGFGGWVDTSCLMVDKLACHEALPAWCLSRYAHGVGEDREVFERLKGLPFGATEQYTVFYRTALDGVHPYILWKYKQAGVDIARYLSPGKMPSESVWAECARHDSIEREREERPRRDADAARAAGSQGIRYSVSYTMAKPPRGQS
jgi:hypothetical protein